MKKTASIPEDVLRFISDAAKLVGRLEAESFSQRMHAEILERPIESPIEQLFLAAMHVTCRSLFLEVNPDPDMGPAGLPVWLPGIWIHPQAPLGPYKIDFAVVWELGFSPDRQVVLVELDGHEFHDRDKRQRSYEKARDRELQRLGHRVLHFTGSDVVRDPYKVAHEVLFTLGVTGDAYVEGNPFGLE